MRSTLPLAHRATLATASLALLLLSPAMGCSFSDSSQSISKSISSPFEWSSASSDSSSPDDDGNGGKSEKQSGDAYRRDVSQLASAYARNGGDIDAFRRAVTRLALERGISNWEVDAATCEGLGQGFRAGGMAPAELEGFTEALFGDDPVRQASVRKGYAAAPQARN